MNQAFVPEDATQEREQWLAQRRQGIGGSDAAPALGLSKYKTTFELWLEKTGQLENNELALKEYVHFGRIMEDLIAREYARRNGVKVRRRNQVLKHPKYPWMLANVDRLVDGKKVGLECKNVDSMAYRLGEWGEDGSDQVPEEYLLQSQHYMIVLGYPEWDLAACVGGNQLRQYKIQHDPSLAEMIIDGEHDFWQRVEKHEAPAPDFSHATTSKLLSRLYPGTDGSTVEFEASMEHWHRVREEASVLARQYEQTAEHAKNHIMAAMGQAALGKLPDGSAYRRKVIQRKAFTVDPTSYIDMRHVKAEKVE